MKRLLEVPDTKTLLYVVIQSDCALDVDRNGVPYGLPRGIFGSLEKADEFVAACEAKRLGPDYQIREFELDEVTT